MALVVRKKQVQEFEMGIESQFKPFARSIE